MHCSTVNIKVTAHQKLHEFFILKFVHAELSISVKKNKLIVRLILNVSTTLSLFHCQILSEMPKNIFILSAFKYLGKQGR